MTDADSTAVSTPTAAWQVGFFADDDGLKAAARACRTAGWQVDAVTPWPVHGLDPILGLERSWIGRPVLGVILLGLLAAMGGLHFLGVVDWPLNVSGKPYFAWPLFVVPVLETALLIGAIVNFNLALHTSRLLPNPLVEIVSARCTDDRHALVVLGADPAAVRAKLIELGASEVGPLVLTSALSIAHGETAHV